MANAYKGGFVFSQMKGVFVQKYLFRKKDCFLLGAGCKKNEEYQKFNGIAHGRLHLLTR
ncbi:MAG: hypothetical protein PWP31_1297 [Clostridia bacterium]|nr:hypothetical protein [Clostridia bacterium]